MREGRDTPFIVSVRPAVDRTISGANLTNDPPARTIRHHLESIHAKIFTKVQNRGVGRRGGRGAVWRLRVPQTFRRWPPIPQAKRIAGRRSAAAEQAKIDLERIKAIAPLKDVKWSQLGGSINDASCLNKTEIYGVVEVKSVDDIAKTLAFARDNKLSITTAGVRHSMGGQAFRKGGIVLDMRGFNKVVLNESDAIDHGAAGRDLARHPEHAASALCGARDAVDRYFQRRRLDLGQCPRHGPSGRRAPQIDQVDEGDAGGRLAENGVGDREQGSVQPRGRRLRPVRRHRRGRTRYRG